MRYLLTIYAPVVAPFVVAVTVSVAFAADGDVVVAVAVDPFDNGLRALLLKYHF